MSPKKLLIIGYIWPEPRSSAAGLRSMSLLRIFADAGYETHYASPAQVQDGFEGKLRELGIQTRSIAPNDSSFDSWIGELQPNIVIFDRFMMEEQFGWRVGLHSPRSLKVLDTVDLHFLRRSRQQETEKRVRSTEADENSLREIAAIYRCDRTLLISDFEMSLLPQEPYRVPAALLQEFGFCYDPPPAPGLQERRDFVFIGNFRHDPNADAVEWLRQEIWPEIRRLMPAAQVHIYGAYPPKSIMQLNSPTTGFQVKGPALDQYVTLSRYQVNLAPIRFGAGLKGKISDGWWCDTPCISTSIGAEGMTLNGSFGGVIADDPRVFARAACELYASPEKLGRARETGREILAAKFDHAANAARLLRELAEIERELDAHRARNFTGRMLAHHQHRSTEYFSRWIELKGRKPV